MVVTRKFKNKEKKKSNLHLKVERKKISLNFLKVEEKKDLNLHNLKKTIRTLSVLPRKSSATTIKKRCVASGRARGLISSFRLSRLILRKLGRKGKIHSLRKLS